MSIYTHEQLGKYKYLREYQECTLQEPKYCLKIKQIVTTTLEGQ